MLLLYMATLATLCCNALDMGESTQLPTTTTNHTLALPQKVELPAQSSDINYLVISNLSESIDISSAENWFGIVGGKQRLAAEQSHNVALWVEPNFSTTSRKGIITVTRLSDSYTTTISVTQPPYFDNIVEGFPARLETQSCDNDRWESDGLCSPKNGSAVLSAVSVNGKRLTFIEDKGISLAGTHRGDYFIYAVPVKNLPAGEQIDFMCTLVATEPDAPKYWLFEYWDNNRWNTINSELRVAEEDPTIKYSFYNKYFKSAHHTTFTQSFTLSNPVVNGCVKVRLRTLSEGSGATKVSSGRYMSMYLIRYKDAPPIVDRKRMLFIGNSFTYFFGTAFMLKEIARSQGHQIDAVISVKGGQEFCEHLMLERSLEAISRGGYHYAFLQDTSPNAAIYADTGKEEILTAARTINNLTLKYSPDCQIIYERTWGCPHKNYRGYGSYDRLDYLLKKGSELLKKRLKEHNIIVSPIGLGFRIGREYNLPLLHTDNRHQSRIGAYMKACINYLVVYGTHFNSNVSDCGLDATTAATVRQIAEQVVLDGVKERYK